MSGVRCQVSGVRCGFFFFFFFFFMKKMVEIVGGGSVINGAYPVIGDYIEHEDCLLS